MPFLFQNLYWADSGDLVAISSESSFYILKFNVSSCSHFLSKFQKLFTFTSQFHFLTFILVVPFTLLEYNASFILQKDAVFSYLESGRPVDEEGVEDAFELIHETEERVRTGLWVGDCFIYNNSSWRLNYCIGGEVFSLHPK